MKLDIVKCAVVGRNDGCFGPCGGLGMPAEVAAGLSAAHGMQQLGRGAGGGADNVQRTAAPVGGHLASAAGRIGGRSYSLQQHVVGHDAKGKAERPVAIVGEEPVVAGTQRQRRAHLKRLVAGRRNLEVYLLLTLEQDFAVVHASRQEHQAVDFNQLPVAQAA